MKRRKKNGRAGRRWRFSRLLWPVAAVAAFAIAGCATMGVDTRTLETTPIVQCYTKMGSEADVSRAQAEGCPSCIY